MDAPEDYVFKHPTTIDFSDKREGGMGYSLYSREERILAVYMFFKKKITSSTFPHFCVIIDVINPKTFFHPNTLDIFICTWKNIQYIDN